MLLRMLGPVRASGDQTDAHGDECNANPALGAHMLIEPEAGEQCHEYISDGGGWKNKSEIGKRECSHVAGHEAQQTKDSYDHPWIAESAQNMREMVNVYGTNVFHATGQECVSDGAEDNNAKQDQIFAKRQSAFPEPIVERENKSFN
jgi:hypothetical protein